MEGFEELIGLPLDVALGKLKQIGKEVKVKVNSLPKIQTDYQLITSVKLIDENLVEVTVGDFLINIENKIK